MAPSLYKSAAWSLIATSLLATPLVNNALLLPGVFLGALMLWAGQLHEREFVRSFVGLWLTLLAATLTVLAALTLLFAGPRPTFLFLATLVVTTGFAAWQILFGQLPIDRDHARALHLACPTCHYDLRATPNPEGPRHDRCPECGTWTEH